MSHCRKMRGKNNRWCRDDYVCLFGRDVWYPIRPDSHAAQGTIEPTRRTSLGDALKMIVRGAIEGWKNG